MPGDAAVPPRRPHPSEATQPPRVRALITAVRHAAEASATAGGVAAALDVAVTFVEGDPRAARAAAAARPDHAALRLLRSAAAAAAARGAALLDYVNEVVQETTPDTNDTDASAAVQLMTVHQAKGLEADAVHVVGLQDGEFPMKRGEIAEEVRVLYVALTRARHWLGWTHRAEERRRPSRLLAGAAAGIVHSGPKKSVPSQ